MGNHMVSNSASAINATDDVSATDPDESILSLAKGPRRRKHDDEATEGGEGEDVESLTSAAQGLTKEEKQEEEKELPGHACAYEEQTQDQEHHANRSTDTAEFTTLRALCGALHAVNGSVVPEAIPLLRT